MKFVDLFAYFRSGPIVADSRVQQRRSRQWAFAARLTGCAGLILLGIYWLTDWLPVWFGYLLGPMGLAAWYCLIQSQEARRSAELKG